MRLFILVASFYYASVNLLRFYCDAFNFLFVSKTPTLLSWSSNNWSRPKTTPKILWLSSSPQSRIIVNATTCNDECKDGINHFVTKTTYFDTSLSSDYRTAGDGQNKRKLVTSWLRRRRRPDNMSSAKVDAKQQSSPTYRFTYDYNEMIIDSAVSKRANVQQTKSTAGIILIHPIGVGIGKWYYHRLFTSLWNERCDKNNTLPMEDRRLVILAPDLLGSATACFPTDIASGTAVTKKLPLLNITDWSSQIVHLMAEYEFNCSSEERGYTIDNWIIVANGGCSPIALHVAASSSSTMLNQTSILKSHRAPVSNVILSSPPRLSFFLPNTTASAAVDPNKVHKSYRTLSGIVGRLFWWYALRNDGAFIQKFSERNLVGNATNLGEEWTPNCIATARLHNGQSRYSTFAFLAGALQDGCAESLRRLRANRDSNAGTTKIDFIRGTDGRRNRAKSWFWTSRRRKRPKEGGVDTMKDGGAGGKSGSDVVSSVVEEMTIQQYVSINGNRGKEVFVDGARISLAWENADEYAKRLLELCAD